MGWLAKWNVGDVLTAAELNKSVGLVADSTLGGAAATIDLTGLPTTYAALLVLVEGRSDTAAAFTTMLARFNNDSGANYSYVNFNASAAGTFTVGGGATSIELDHVLPAATAAASNAGMSALWIPAYSQTTFFKSFWAGQTGYDAANFTSGLVGGRWASTAAINRITLLPGAGNFIAGSRASVYVLGS